MLERRLGDALNNSAQIPDLTRDLVGLRSNVQEWNKWVTKSVGDLQTDITEAKKKVLSDTTSEFEARSDVPGTEIAELQSRVGIVTEKIDGLTRLGREKIRVLEERIQPGSQGGVPGCFSEMQENLTQLDRRMKLVENWVARSVESRGEYEKGFFQIQQFMSDSQNAVKAEMGKLILRVLALEKEISECRPQSTSSASDRGPSLKPSSRSTATSPTSQIHVQPLPVPNSPTPLWSMPLANGPRVSGGPSPTGVGEKEKVGEGAPTLERVRPPPVVVGTPQGSQGSSGGGDQRKKLVRPARVVVGNHGRIAPELYDGTPMSSAYPTPMTGGGPPVARVNVIGQTSGGYMGVTNPIMSEALRNSRVPRFSGRAEDFEDFERQWNFHLRLMSEASNGVLPNSVVLMAVKNYLDDASATLLAG